MAIPNGGMDQFIFSFGRFLENTIKLAEFVFFLDWHTEVQRGRVRAMNLNLLPEKCTKVVQSVQNQMLCPGLNELK